MIRPWQKIGSQSVGDFRIFKVRSDEKISPRTGQTHHFFVIECVNWVNVIAVTPDDHLVMVEQYRHGTNTVELEIPGGMVDREDGSPAVSGARGQREGSGDESENAGKLGKKLPKQPQHSKNSYT